jgi:hypothetical protein
MGGLKMLDSLVDVGIVFGIVVALTGLFYSYYNNRKVRNIANKVLPFLPILFSFLASKVEDKKGVFDTHDTLALLGRVSQRIRGVVSDLSNTSFEDVEEEIMSIVSEELNRYRVAGVSNVPDITDPVIRAQVEAVFIMLQKGRLSEDSAGNNGPDKTNS